MKKLLFTLLLMFGVVSSQAQTKAIITTAMAVSATGYGSGALYGIGQTDAWVDSVWTALVANHVVSTTDIWIASKIQGADSTAIKGGKYSTLANFSRADYNLRPYHIANCFSGATPSTSGLITLPIAAGGTGSTTFSGAQVGLGLNTVYLAADTSITGQTLTGTPLQLALGVSQKWQFDAVIYDSSSSSAGIKFGFALPTGATIVSAGFGQTSGVTAFTSDITTAAATAGAAVATVAGYSVYWASGTITTDATHAGAAILQYLKVTSGTAIIKAGSYIIFRRIS